MSTIEPKKALFVDYPVPPTRLVSIRVAATEPVNVYAMDQAMLDAFLLNKAAPPIAIIKAEVGTRHEISRVQLPVAAKWFLVIANPWDRKVDVEYAVTAATPLASPAVFGGTLGTNATSTGTTVISSSFGTGSRQR